MRNNKIFLNIFLSLCLVPTCPVLADGFDAFNAQLKSVTFNDVICAKKYKEPEAGKIFKVETMGKLSGPRSDLKISNEAKKLIIYFEVTGKNNYDKKLQNPTWPGGASGATVGFGYDIGYSSEKSVHDAWINYIPEETIKGLMTCAGKKGEDGRLCTNKIKKLTIDWDSASKQFEYYLPFLIAQTKSAFKNFELLPPSARGALASLVYNRGADTSNTQRRKEMYNIAKLMSQKEYSKIPEQIELMKKLWPNTKGLLIRRDLEAELFRIGIKNNE